MNKLTSSIVASGLLATNVSAGNPLDILDSRPHHNIKSHVTKRHKKANQKTSKYKIIRKGMTSINSKNPLDILSSIPAKVQKHSNKVSKKTHSIIAYGTSHKSYGQSYNGAGLRIEGDTYKIIAEQGGKYSKLSAIGKKNVNRYLYIKGGVGYLRKKIKSGDFDSYVEQTNIGGAIGYGDDKNYNIEAGYINSHLHGARRASGDSNIEYIEATIRKNPFEFSATASNTRTYHKNHLRATAEIGYYVNDDLRIGANYDTMSHPKNDYSIQAGFNYKFNGAKGTKGKLTTYLKAKANVSRHVALILEYREGIKNIPLSMRTGFFEKTIATNNIIAQEVDPDEFKKRLQKNETTNILDPEPEEDNNIPEAQNFEVDADGKKSYIIETKPYISDLDGDNLKVRVISAENYSGDLEGITTSVDGTKITISVTGGTGDAKIIYEVDDGKGGTDIAKIIVKDLDGEF